MDWRLQAPSNLNRASKVSRACKIGRDVVENAVAWKRVQKSLSLKVDGWPGDKTVLAIQQKLGIATEVPSGFPTPDYSSMLAAYGRPGDETNLVRVNFPYAMRLYSRDAKANITSHRCHAAVAESLQRVLGDLLYTFGQEWITHHGLDVFGGIYNARKKRGGSSWSKHAWGVAIDLNPAENGLRTKWREDRIGESGFANMPIQAIEIFEKHGWKSLARKIGRDAMHFEATS